MARISPQPIFKLSGWETWWCTLTALVCLSRAGGVFPHMAVQGPGPNGMYWLPLRPRYFGVVEATLNSCLFLYQTNRLLGVITLKHEDRQYWAYPFSRQCFMDGIVQGGLSPSPLLCISFARACSLPYLDFYSQSYLSSITTIITKYPA